MKYLLICYAIIINNIEIINYKNFELIAINLSV